MCKVNIRAGSVDGRCVRKRLSLVRCRAGHTGVLWITGEAETLRVCGEGGGYAQVDSYPRWECFETPWPFGSEKLEDFL